MSTALAQPAQALAIRTITPERWQRASERAQLAQVSVTAIDDLGTYQVTSASHPAVSYESDGVHCTCTAAAHGDPICLHRTAVRDHLAAQQPRCTICSDSGIEYISVWSWKDGAAVTVSQMPCRCQPSPEPDPPAPVALLDRELAETMADLERNQERLSQLNEKMTRQGGRLSDRDFEFLSREGERNRELHDRVRALKAQMAAGLAQNVQVVA